MIPISQVRHREVRRPAQGHNGEDWLSGDRDSRLSEARHLTCHIILSPSRIPNWEFRL